MGLFDLFKKKQKVTVTFQAPISAPAEHETWEKINGNADNDYANTIFLYFHKGKYRKPHTLDDTTRFSHKFSKVGISAPERKHSDMLREGYFCEATHAEVLNTYRVDELKQILENNGFTPEGRKADLIKAILESIPVKKLQLPVMYFISDKGMEYMEQHEDLIELFGNPYKVTYEEYMEAKQDAPSYLKYNDIIWKVFNLRELSFSPTDNFSRRYNAYYRAEFLKSEGKHTASLVEYLTVAYYDIEKDLATFDRVPLSQWSKKGLTQPETKLYQPLAEAICNAQEYYQKDMPEKVMRRTNVIHKHLTVSQFKSYVDTLMETGNSDYSKYAKK